MGMFDTFGRFVGALVMGDQDAAVAVLREEPGGSPVCERCASKSHKEGDEACVARDGEFRCIGHGAEGNCIMGRPSK